MSSMQYVSVKAHVVTKQEVGRNLARKVVDSFSSEGDGIDWHEVTIKDGEGYTDAVVKYSGVDVGLMTSVNKVLEEVAALGDGSYGLMISEGDWGLESFDCYGSVELVETDAVEGDTVWASEDFLQLSVAMRSDAWQELLECSPDSLLDEIEMRGDDMLPLLVPEAFVQACEDDGEVFFEFRETEVLEEEPDEISAIFEFDGHDLGHETFEALVEALGCPRDELPVPEAKILLALENAPWEDGWRVNRLVDIDVPAMLVFKSSWDGIGVVRILVPRATEE